MDNINVNKQNAFSFYQTRPIRFLEILEHENWKIKLYSISVKSEKVSDFFVKQAKKQLSEWLAQSTYYADLATYNIATLILHEGKEGCFAIINWWIDENMLQQFVYLASKENSDEFVLFSDKGIITCTWEMAVLWFERNAWVEKVLKQPNNPNAFDNYLQQHYNADI